MPTLTVTPSSLPLPMPYSTTASPKKKAPKKRALKRSADASEPQDEPAVPRAPRKTLKQSKYEREMAFEHTISRILLCRFEGDIARLFSTHIFRIAETFVPRLIMSILPLASPGWLALNAGGEPLKDFFRGALAFDMRQAQERVATRSVLWSYTAIRHFATSHNVQFCGHRGLHSHLLLPHHSHLRAHLRSLESPSSSSPTFSKPPHLGSLQKGYATLEKYCVERMKRNSAAGARMDEWVDWRIKVREGYERIVETLWEVANEINVRGYGLILREKLSEKWCCLSCLGTYLEVCEPSLDPPSSSKSSSKSKDPPAQRSTSPSPLSTKGKEREWDGRGHSVPHWETPREEDVWAARLGFSGNQTDYLALYLAEGESEDVLTVGELMELRYLRGEREKAAGNAAFKKQDFDLAIEHYEKAYRIEPEIPHYQLNIAAANLKLCRWAEAEKACTIALGQQKSSKAYYRRAKARKEMGRLDEAEEDLMAILEFQSTNTDALTELENLRPPPEPTFDPSYAYGYSNGYLTPPASPHAAFSSPASCSHRMMRSPSPRRPDICSGPKLNERPIPWEIHERDRAVLRIGFTPLEVYIDPMFGMERFAYPGWERYSVSKG